jgi:AraC-like DNA-binding protein
MTRAEHATPSHLVLPLIAFAKQRGAVLDLPTLGLPAEPTDDTPVSPRVLGALFDAVAAALDEPHLGLLLPAGLAFSRYELPDLAVRSSPTLRESLHRLSRYAPLLSDAVSFGFEERDGTGRFSHRVAGHPRGINRHLNEFAMAMGVHECSARTGLPMPVREVCFVNPRPRSLDALVAWFGTPALHFGRLENMLVFDAAVLDAPQKTADPRMLQTAEGLADEAMRRRGAVTEGFRPVVERSLRGHLEQGTLSIRAVALGLRMSTRTLQRRLGDEGTSYAQVLDEVREGLARVQVAAREPSLSEIAFGLGFAEFATFSRAFKRWTGMPPGAWRASVSQ